MTERDISNHCRNRPVQEIESWPALKEQIRVLIIEDDDILSDLLRSILQSDTVDVHTCTSGRCALAAMSKKRFDVFMTDYRLPGMSGDEIVKTLRVACPESRIIGMSVQNKEKEFREAGADGFLLKPFGIEELLAQVRGDARQGCPPE